ncbi:MmgE/PrpD family protein [Xanthobacter flavus]|uniref:MmgE/PrpD family protein n=1 Tax=Xanthobacter flavus TaxID=281 RepID=UPI00372916BE
MATDLKPLPLSVRLGSFLCGYNTEAIPTSVRHEAKRAMIGYFATAFTGSRDHSYGVLHRLLASGSRPEAALVGHREKVDARDAAFLNAVAANLHDFDDTHIPTIIHPTAPIAAALFALAAQHPINGKAFIGAFVLGAEVSCRLGIALTGQHYQRGWHITSTCGVIGAAAACAKGLALSEQETAAAMGCAASQAQGLVECLGSSAKSLAVGNAARNGLFSALLAQRGFDAPPTTLDGPFGFLAVFSDYPAPDAVMHGIGSSWALLSNTHKPYPCGVVVNPVIDCCLKARENRAFTPDEIDHIVFQGHPLLGTRADRPNIHSAREAKVSLQHAAAVTLVEGPPGLAHFAEVQVLRPELADLRARIRFEPAELPIDAARMCLVTKAGDTVRTEVAHAYGGLANPMSDSDLEDKLKALAGGPPVMVDTLARTLWKLDDLPDVTQIMSMAAIPAMGEILQPRL